MENQTPHRKDRSEFVSALARICADEAGIFDLNVLVLGGSRADHDSLAAAGFKNIKIDEFSSSKTASLDCENLTLNDESVDVVLMHEVLHHCRSPHRALCEALRVARKYVIFMEPNDSFAMRCLVRFHYSDPFELMAVSGNDYKRGGVRDTPVPNYIFRWNEPEVKKLVSSWIPERRTEVVSDGYWDFNIDADSLRTRNARNLRVVLSVIGAENFLRIILFAKKMINQFTPTRAQGNKFLCLIKKREELMPWLENADGLIRLKR